MNLFFKVYVCIYVSTMPTYVFIEELPCLKNKNRDNKTISVKK